jgi:hypothetical protein
MFTNKRDSLNYKAIIGWETNFPFEWNKTRSMKMEGKKEKIKINWSATDTL